MAESTEEIENTDGEFVVLQVNARCQPLDRDQWEDPLAEWLQEENHGDITGGGTMLDANRRIEYCDTEMVLATTDSRFLSLLIAKLEELGIPKGSKLQLSNPDRVIPIGQTEGLALFLNGSELPDEVYQSSDVNVVIEKLMEALGDTVKIRSYGEYETETALYFYGESFSDMQNRISRVVASEPLCEKCRVVQDA